MGYDSYYKLAFQNLIAQNIVYYFHKGAIVVGILRGYINIWGYHIKSLIKIGNHILQYEWPEYYMYLNVF